MVPLTGHRDMSLRASLVPSEVRHDMENSLMKVRNVAEARALLDELQKQEVS